ncbi:MAG: hypothetical protein CSA66_03110 [Proteobacteria bacterium]|nr:MAG: hypothetical protein CSA66_03110 [Pseudomonadota bacterium]
MDGVDTATKARLARGEVLVAVERVAGSKAPRLVVQAMIDVPPDKVWDCIDKSARYETFMPRVKRSEELSRDGDAVRTRLTVAMPFPMKDLSATTRAHHTVTPGERWVRRWRLESGDYKRNEGAWTFTPFDGDPGRTYAHYQIIVEPRIPVPRFVRAGVQERAMPSMIEALRTEARRR